MTTMLDKCAVAGDITQGIDRRGVWTAAITVIGGTSGTAVKLVSSDTVNGEYTDYKTLVSAADAETDQYKGFVVDLYGAKKFIKVTGAVMATAVFGDCDHDVKNIAITEGEVPSGADLENNHEVTITENGEIEITPATGKDGMKKVTATVNVSGGGSDVPTEWYLWQDNIGKYRYLPFETAPDTLDSMQYIMIGDSLTSDTSLSTMEIASYIKISDSSFGIGKASYNRITEDVPIGGGGGGATPSTEMPAWFNDYEESIVPSGVQIVGVTRERNGTIILTGDGQHSITELLTGGRTFHTELVSYGESIVFAYDLPM